MTVTAPHRGDILTAAVHAGTPNGCMRTLVSLMDAADAVGSLTFETNSRQAAAIDRPRLMRLEADGLITYEPRRGRGATYPVTILVPENA